MGGGENVGSKLELQRRRQLAAEQDARSGRGLRAPAQVGANQFDASAGTANRYPESADGFQTNPQPVDPESKRFLSTVQHRPPIRAGRPGQEVRHAGSEEQMHKCSGASENCHRQRGKSELLSRAGGRLVTYRILVAAPGAVLCGSSAQYQGLNTPDDIGLRAPGYYAPVPLYCRNDYTGVRDTATDFPSHHALP